jgi:probable rRNA maturation factor
VKITIRNLQKTIPINPKKIKEIILEILSGESAASCGQINVCFVSDKEIRKLNWKYLGQNTATDVLAFDLSDKKNEIIADIFVSTEKAVANAKLFKSTPFSENHLYVIHGLLHILGYNDSTEKETLAMRQKEKKYLSRINS